ncbi:hypothetical protein [Kitasatospora griseola]|uniref:hypothetical protein n=1 Tax=Kitasatospora griseola TaxID=2064 RepID=UPI003648ECE8
MKIRRLAATAAAGAVLAPLLVLAAGAQANADVLPPLPPPSQEAQCAAAYNLNVALFGVAFAQTQYYACMGD